MSIVQERKKVKIKFVGFWDGVDPDNNLIVNILKERYDVEISEDPDYIFASVFERKVYSFPKYDSIRIFLHLARTNFSGHNPYTEIIFN